MLLKDHSEEREKHVIEQKGRCLVIRREIPKQAEARSQIPRWYKGGSRNLGVRMAWKVQGLELNLQDTQVDPVLKARACEDRCWIEALMPMNMRQDSGVQQ